MSSTSQTFRSTDAPLRENAGSRGRGPGTQHLSRKTKLAASVLIDLIGMSSYFLPVLGQILDLGWAPVSAALVYYLYGNGYMAGLAFVEEILPFTDIIPTATMAWFITNSKSGQKLQNVAARRNRR